MDGSPKKLASEHHDGLADPDADPDDAADDKADPFDDVSDADYDAAVRKEREQQAKRKGMSYDVETGITHVPEVRRMPSAKGLGSRRDRASHQSADHIMRPPSDLT